MRLLRLQRAFRLQVAAAVLISLLLTAYVSFLLISNYNSNKALQKNLTIQFQQECERRMIVIQNFFSDRKEDVLNLALSREVSVFFENRDLGMSMAYGLNLSLIPIRERFQELIARRMSGGEAVYSRIVLLDKTGGVLADTASTSGAPGRPFPKSFLAPNYKNGSVFASEDRRHLLVSIAYYFKNAYAGQIIAWMKPELLDRQFLNKKGPSLHQAYILVKKEGTYQVVAGPPRADGLDISAIPAFDLSQEALMAFIAKQKDQPLMLALRLPIPETPFFLVTLVHTAELTGTAKPYQLFVVLGILAAGILGGAIFILVVSVRTLVLRTRLDESLALAKELQTKHEALETEMAERRKAEEALGKSEELFRTLLFNMLDAVIIIDWNGTVLFANPATARLVDLENADAALGQNMAQFLHPDSMAKALEDLITVQQGISGFPGEYKIITATGQEKWVSSLGVEIPFHGISADFVTMRDMTERKQLEEAIHQAKENAEAANRAKSDFLASMSHELRTPLNAIIGFTEIVLDQHFGSINEQQAEYLGHVLQSSRHLLSLINDVLDLSKIEAGKMELEPSEVDFRGLLSSSLTLIKETAARHGFQVSMNVDREIPEIITADERKLKQILYNLLANAVKFTPDGGTIVLSVLRSRRLEMGRDVFRISIADSGIGIKAADLDRIFNPFEQADGSASRRYQGTGLGLSLSRRFVELHGGRLWAESEGEGKGSTFHVEIPEPSKISA